MNNFSSFLDTSAGPNMPRQPPSPSQAAAGGAHPGNGIGNTANSIPMVNGLASGGQQTDMNHLWTVVQQLSQLLEENRAQTAGIVNGVQAIQQRAAEEGVGSLSMREVNGEINAASRQAEVTNLTTQLQSAQTTITSLTDTNTALRTLITDYENALTLLLDKLRPYAYNQTQAMLALHKHYQGLIEQERAVNVQIRREHSEWQDGLKRVNDWAKKAMTAQAENELPYQRELKALKEENRVLRRLAGWEERADSSDEEEERQIN